jgi:hypothetical protein
MRPAGGEGGGQHTGTGSEEGGGQAHLRVLGAGAGEEEDKVRDKVRGKEKR